MVMKKFIIICIAIILKSLSVKADNLIVSNQKIVKNQSSTCVISLNNTNSKSYVSFQMDLTLPEGVGINKDDCKLGNCIKDSQQELTIGKIGDNKYRLTSTSFSLINFSTSKYQRELIHLSLKATENISGGVATLSNIRFVQIYSSGSVSRNILENVSFNISILDIIEFADATVKSICVSKMDKNGDGELDTDEVTSIRSNSAGVNFGTIFKGNTEIVSFNELQYFTELGNIPNNCFSGCKNLRSIVLPDNITDIGYAAFSGCSSLTSIDIPDNIETIKAETFMSCENLTSIIIPNGVTTIEGSSFMGCQSLSTVVIPSSVTSIGSNTFDGCSSLMDLDIPDEVITIGAHAFQRCQSLSNVVIPSSVTNIGEGIFAGCNNLSSIVVAAGNTKYDSRNNCNAIIDTENNALIMGCKNSIIPSSVISIEPYAFSQCKGFTSLDIPNSVTSIRQYAFSQCKGLTRLDIPNSVTSIGQYAFEGCSNLISIDIPSSVSYIGDNAFRDCSSLSSIVIPNSLTNIENYTFIGCSSLTNIEIPNNILSIGFYAFGHCSSLTSINIPNSVLNMAGYVFYDCSSLTRINLPNDITCIKEYSFSGCSSLVYIEIPENVTTIEKYAFNDCSKLSAVRVKNPSPISITNNVFTNRANATLTVPSGSKSLYKAADYWKEFKEIIELVPQPTTDDYLSADALKMRSGETATIDILLNNEIADYTAYQFDLTLPEGFSIAKNKKDKWDVTKGERYEDDTQQLTVNFQDASTNTYRILCFSMSNGVIEDTEGCILKVAVKAGEDLEESDYFAKIKNVTFTCVDGTGYILPDTQFKITINNVIPGDANGDGIVNVTDIVEMVNYILNKPSASFIRAAADVNSDGLVNVTDIVCTVTIIMSSGVNNTAPRRAETTKTYYDLLTLNSTDHGKKLALELNNESDFVAAQFDVRLSDGQQVKNILLNSRRTNGHALTWSMIDANTCRVLVYSLSNKTFRENAGELLQIELTGTSDTVVVDNITFVNSAMEAKLFDPIYGGTTGIQTMKSDEAEKVYYDLNGRKLNQRPSTKGVYIKNGQKYIVK